MRVMVAFVLAFLIGNPACCCATVLPAPDHVAKDETLRPCCRKLLAETTGETPDHQEPAPSAPCPCSKKLGLLQLEKRGAVVAPEPWQPVLVAVGGWSPEAFSDHDDSGSWQPPPGRLSVKSPPAWILYRVFRC